MPRWSTGHSDVPPVGACTLRIAAENARLGQPEVKLGIIPFSADRSALHPVEMFFMHDDAQVNIELVSGWLRVTQPGEVEMYAEAFARLAETAAALCPPKS